MANEQFDNPQQPAETADNCLYAVRMAVNQMRHASESQLAALKAAYEMAGTAAIEAASSEAEKDEIVAAYAAFKTAAESLGVTVPALTV